MTRVSRAVTRIAPGQTLRQNGNTARATALLKPLAAIWRDASVAPLPRAILAERAVRVPQRDRLQLTAGTVQGDGDAVTGKGGITAA